MGVFQAAEPRDQNGIGRIVNVPNFMRLAAEGAQHVDGVGIALRQRLAVAHPHHLRATRFILALLPRKVPQIVKDSGVEVKLFQGKEPQFGAYYTHLNNLADEIYSIQLRFSFYQFVFQQLQLSAFLFLNLFSCINIFLQQILNRFPGRGGSFLYLWEQQNAIKPLIVAPKLAVTDGLVGVPLVK